MKNKITIINFSAALTQEDAFDGENKGLKYYSTQKGALISYLISKFPNISIDIIGLNTTFLLNVNYHKSCKFIKLPNRTIPIFSSIFFNLTSFISLFWTQKPLIIYIYSSGETLPYIGTLIYAKLFRLPIFMCIRNPPKSLFSFDYLSVLEKMFIKFLDKLFFKYSTKIIHISEKAKDLLKPYPEQYYQKSIVMGSCPTNIFLDPLQKKKIEKTGLTFAYWGIMDRTRDMDIVINGFVKAKELNDNFNAKFYLFGGGKDLERLKELVKELKTQDIIFKGYVGQEELCNFLQGMSVAVIPIPPKDIFQYSAPLKLAEAVTIELPVIASNIEPNQIVKEHNLGILCKHDVDCYAQAFLKFWCFSDSELNGFRENCKNVKYLFTPETVFKEVGDAIAHEIQQRGH